MMMTPQRAQNANLAEAVRAATAPGAGVPSSLLNVVFATPTNKFGLALRTHGSTIETESFLAAHGIAASFIYREGDAFVAKARNKLVTEFLHDYPTIDNFFFIDDDVGWDHQQHKILEFLQRSEDVVGGTYPKKSMEVDFPLGLLVDLETGDLVENNGLYGALMIPTGFMRIKRHVLEKLASVSNMFTDQEPEGKIGEYYYIFESGRGITSHKKLNKWGIEVEVADWWGEDYVFCRKCLDYGFSLWVDPEINFTHQGQYTFKGQLSDHLHVYRRKAKQMVAQQKKEERKAKALVKRNGGVAPQVEAAE